MANVTSRGKRIYYPLLFTSRQVYSEAIHMLYAANAFHFSQSFCLRNFTDALPAHRLDSIHRLRYDLHLHRHPALNLRTRRDWKNVWVFFTERFGGLTLLRVDIGMNFATAWLICGETEDGCKWLLSVVQIVEMGRLDEVSGSGNSIEQRMLSVGPPGGGRDKGTVNVNEAVQKAKSQLEPGDNGAKLEAITTRYVHKQLQDSITGWLHLIEK